MIIVETIALSTMVMHSIIMPALINFHDAPRFPAVILNIKRLVIMAIVCIGYWFTTSVGGLYSLVDMGLRSFEAVALFAPAFFWAFTGSGAPRQGRSRDLLRASASGFILL